MAQKIIYILLVLCFVVGFLEVVTRRILPVQNYYAHPMYQYDRMLGHSFKKSYNFLTISYEGKPFFFTTNSCGWRDFEFNKDDFVGKKIIVFLGDSLLETAGARMEDTLPKVTERELNKAENKEKYRCLNFGLGDIGQSEEYLIWKNYARLYKPDIVVLQLFLFNDVLNNSLYYAGKYNSDGDYLRPYISLKDGKQPKIVYKNSFLAFLRIHSALFRECEIRLLSLIGRYGERIGIRKSRDVFYESSSRRGLFPSPENFLFLQNKVPREYEEARMHTIKLILEIKKDVELSGARFYILSIPWLEQVDEDSRVVTVLDAKNKPHYYKINYDKPERELSAFLKKNNIKSYFILDDLRGYLKITNKNNEDLWCDGHLNKIGLEICGKNLAKRLIEDLGL